MPPPPPFLSGNLSSLTVEFAIQSRVCPAGSGWLDLGCSARRSEKVKIKAWLGPGSKQFEMSELSLAWARNKVIEELSLVWAWGKVNVLIHVDKTVQSVARLINFEHCCPTLTSF